MGVLLCGSSWGFGYDIRMTMTIAVVVIMAIEVAVLMIHPSICNQCHGDVSCLGQRRASRVPGEPGPCGIRLPPMGWPRSSGPGVPTAACSPGCAKAHHDGHEAGPSWKTVLPQ